MTDLQPFDRHFLAPERRLSRLGGGALGGKAQGLLLAHQVLERRRGELAAPPVGSVLDLDVPALVVLGTDLFDAFLDRNDLRPLIAEEPSDQRLALAFQHGDLPEEWTGDLMSLATEVRTPLAVRSSSALEDALGQPFAGVYATKMIPANQRDASARFKALIEAVKFVWASTYFHGARAYLRATGRRQAEERMAVVVQEVVGSRRGDRHYPTFSGVARSINFYPVGDARPEDGVIHLAAGLGKTIVDGGKCWSFSVARPRVGPPVGSPKERLTTTQTELWALWVGAPPPWNPTSEVEHLVSVGLAEAEADGILKEIASTYDPTADRFVPGLGRSGPRVLDFAPLLHFESVPLVALVRRLLAVCEEAVGAPVEIEFAVDLARSGRGRFGLLQVRPLVASDESIEVTEAELEATETVVASRAVMGNGRQLLEDVVYVEPDGFEALATPEIAGELEELNRALAAEGRHYLLVGFGRWGSSDPWLGVPVRWDQISEARAIVEATLPQMNPEPSQGSHFFHNLSSFKVGYLTVPHDPGGAARAGRIDWAWLAGQPLVARLPHVRHVRACSPLEVRLDGRTRRGVVTRRPTP